MKPISCILLLFLIDAYHRSFAIDEPPEDCSQCSFEDTSTLPNVGQCWSKNKLIKEDEQFLRIIECGIRTHCKIADPCRRVRSIKSSYSYGRKSDNIQEYDFVIVGAGVAGPILANRLSKNPTYTVLLLEAGPEEPIGPSLPYFFSSALKSKLDWQYETTKQANACLGNEKPGICEWPRGKMIGGTSSMSGMMYSRGSPAIYDDWASKGNKGWSYEKVLRYFKKSENNTQNKNKIDATYHGFEGPMPVTNFPHLPPVGKIMLEAAKEVGFQIGDLNGRNQTGFAAMSVMSDNGIRASTGRMYLRPVLHRPNLRVVIESLVTRIKFKNNPRLAQTRAHAVEFIDKFNVKHTVRAKKEIILSGGTVGSAQLLMLSGIGPQNDLRKIGINVVQDLPVGRNVHHHVGVEGTAEFHNMQEYEFSLQSLETYLKNQTGPFSSTGLTQVSGFWSSSAASKNIPDIQFFLDPYCSEERCSKFNKKWTNKTLAGMRSIYLVSKCRGTIKLASKDPHDKPIIDPNYLCDQTDINATIEGIRKLEQILKATPFKGHFIKFGAANESSCREHAKYSNDYWKCQVRTNTLGENHHAGSCKMGPANDTEAVVNPQLQVYGVANLRVIDASIMPTPINCNTIAPVIMIAEKGADMILNSWGK